MDLSIVIVNFETRELLKENLDAALAAAEEVDGEILVVDNHSADGSAAMVRERYPSVRVLENETNIGFAAGANRGIGESTGRHVFILNADARLPETGLKDLLAFAEARYAADRTGIVGVRLLNTDGTLQYSKGRFPTLARTLADAFRPRLRRKYCFRGYEAPGETDWVTGAGLLVRRELLEEVGLLDENFFLYYEDVDLCWRARKGGWKVAYCPAVSMYHSNPYAGREKALAYIPVEIRRSHLYFYRKNYSAVSFSALWLMTLFYALGGAAAGAVPWFGNGNGRRNGHVHRRILKEVLFNGHANGKAKVHADQAVPSSTNTP